MLFYEPERGDHGLPHDPFKAIVAPRPIGWISTRAKDGAVNLAPYSFFNAVSDHPKLVMFASAGFKDSANLAIESGEFVANMATGDLAEAVNRTSAPAPRGPPRTLSCRARRCPAPRRSACTSCGLPAPNRRHR